MFNFELNDLHADNLQSETLRMLENISEEFQLENDFGVISMTMHELISQILILSVDKNFESTLNFFVDAGELSVQIHHSESLTSLKNIFESVDINHNTSPFIIAQLSDQIEFNNEDQDITVSFHVKPNLKKEKFEVRILRKKEILKENEHSSLYTDEEIEEDRRNRERNRI